MDESFFSDQQPMRSREWQPAITSQVESELDLAGATTQRSAIMAYPWSPRTQLRIDLVLTARAASWIRPHPLQYDLKCLMYLQVDTYPTGEYLVEPSAVVDLSALSRLCDPPAYSESLFIWDEDFDSSGGKHSVSSEFEDPRFIRWDLHGYNFKTPAGDLQRIPERLYFPQRDLRTSALRVIQEIRELEEKFGDRLVSLELDNLNSHAKIAEHVVGGNGG